MSKSKNLDKNRIWLWTACMCIRRYFWVLSRSRSWMIMCGIYREFILLTPVEQYVIRTFSAQMKWTTSKSLKRRLQTSHCDCISHLNRANLFLRLKILFILIFIVFSFFRDNATMYVVCTQCCTRTEPLFGLVFLFL